MCTARLTKTGEIMGSGEVPLPQTQIRRMLQDGGVAPGHNKICKRPFASIFLWRNEKKILELFKTKYFPLALNTQCYGQIQHKIPFHFHGGKALACWVKISADDISKYLFYFSYKTGFDISCKLSPVFWEK